MSGYLVGSPAFKAGGTGDPRPAGSIPVHLRQLATFFSPQTTVAVVNQEKKVYTARRSRAPVSLLG